MDRDLEQLGLLAIFHYIVGGIMALCGCFPFIHLGLGVAMLSGAFHEPGKPAPPLFLGWLLIGIASFAILLSWSLAFCVVLAGRKLAQRRNYTFCFVIAALECFFMPFGTVLGAFTIIVLQRASVKAMFERQPSGGV
jgi:hypothetical protein